MAVEQVETAAAAPKTGSKMTQYSKTGKMVMEAIETLNEKKGSSIMKIRNYITTQNPEIDMTRYGKLVKKFILSALEKGDLTNNDETKGIRGYFKIAPELKKKNKKALKASSDKTSTSKEKSSTSKDKTSTSKEKGSKSASSPKVKKPVSKTVKLPSAVVATTIKKKKKSTKASPAEAEKEQSVTKSKKKATAGTKRGKKMEDEAPVPKKKTKKEAEKPKAKAKPKKAKSVESETDAKAEESVNDVSEVDENVEPEEAEAVEKVARGKGKKKDEVKKPKKVAAGKKKKAAKVDDENKE